MNDFINTNEIMVKIYGNEMKAEHLHQEVEFLYVMEGRIRVSILEKTFDLNGEDMIVINAHERHCIQPVEDALYARLHIPYALIQHVYDGIHTIFRCNSTVGDNENFKAVRKVIKQMLFCQLNLTYEAGTDNKIDFEYFSLFFHLLELLTVHFLMKSSNSVLPGTADKSGTRMAQINDFIQKHYAQAISLRDLSEYLYLSEGYLSRYFRQTYHMKFTDYLKKIRLRYAVDDLLYTDRDITKIACENGFSSVSFFNRVFKETYGMTPSEMRRQKKKKLPDPSETKEKHTLIHQRLERYLHEEKDWQYSQEMIRQKERYSVKKWRRAKQIWKGIINIGRAEDLLKNEIQEHILLLKQSLDFIYVRFWSVFSEVLLIDIKNKQGKYNFTKLDSIVDFLLSVHLKPFIDMEDKVKRINKNVEAAVYYDGSRVQFENMQQWERLIEALIRHWVKRYGVDEISSWKIEVWYDGYDIGGSVGWQRYFEQFNKTRRIIKQYVPEMEVGGCGILPECIPGAEEKNSGFLKQWAENADRPDFISMLNYAYEEDADAVSCYGKRSTDREYLLHVIEHLKAEMSKVGFESCKLYVTEWNLTVSDRSRINDACFMGAYFVKNMIDVYDKADMVGYFTGSDRTSEYYDSNRLLHGGQGLLSKDGIMKPSAFAVEFLNLLYPYVIGKGDNFLITSNLRGNYGIVCHHMKNLSYHYYLTDEEKIEKENIWRCFEDRDILELSIELDDVDDGDYQIKIQRINEKSGSVLDIWKDLGYQDELSRAEIKYFRRICEPRLTIQKARAKNRKIAVRMDMAPNEVAFVLLEKIFDE